MPLNPVTRYLFLLLVVVCGLLCLERAVKADENATMHQNCSGRFLGSFQWEHVTPLEFLDELKKTPTVPRYLQHAPKEWLQPEHLEQLLVLVDSTVPVAATCYIASAHMPPQGYHSTEGLEAARMIECFRRGWSYPGNCSDISHPDVLEIKSWWQEGYDRNNEPR